LIKRAKPDRADFLGFSTPCYMESSARDIRKSWRWLVRGLPLLKGLTKKNRSGVKQTTENNVTKKKLSESKDFAGFFLRELKTLSFIDHAVIIYPYRVAVTP
jgi:Mlc titration factor MtfA (ptsG expression regulator)